LVERLGCRLYGPGSNTGSGRPAVGPTQGVKLTIHLNLASRLRVTGAKPPLPLYAFMACTGKVYLTRVKSGVKKKLVNTFFCKF
jgi:hypothetical protein